MMIMKKTTIQIDNENSDNEYNNISVDCENHSSTMTNLWTFYKYNSNENDDEDDDDDDSGSKQ
jgi:hypothetical protein